MWKRSDLKSSARKKISKNYWLCVAVCFLLGFLTYEYTGSLKITQSYNAEVSFGENVVSHAENKTNLEFINLSDGTITDEIVDVVSESQSFLFKLIGSIENFFKNHYYLAFGLLLAFILEIAYKFLFAYPFIVGSRKFFIENHSKNKVKLRTLLFAFRKGNFYDNIVVTMIFRYIYLVLWTFTIIGLPIKYYEYRMIPYILADNPELNRKEVFKLSKQMMYGNKWKAFVLDLSFIGWNILDAITLGITGILYSNPYHLATFTELYIKLKKESTSN